MESVDPPASSFDSNPQPEIPSPEALRTLSVPRPVLFGSIVVLVGFVGVQSPKLWKEYVGLKQQWSGEVASRVVRYKNITADPSYAAAPANWFHESDDGVKLWAGWDRKLKAHKWFRVGKGDLDPNKLSQSIGRDAAKAIDCPILQKSDGDYWNWIPPEHLMFVCGVDNFPVAFPMAIMNKVVVVNAATSSRPVVVVFKPLDPEETAVEVYNPVFQGKRFLLRQTGYLFASRPLLYDQDEENLWAVDEKGVHAISGPSKGMILPRLGFTKPVPWGDVRTKFAGVTLLVGAERKLEAERP